LKAILTKYHGFSDTHGSRISAVEPGGTRIYIPFAYGDSLEESRYRKAAEVLCEKMGWSGTLISGSIKDGYAFVFTGEVKCR